LTHSTRYSPPQPNTFSESSAHQASSEPSRTRSCSSFPQHHSGEAYTDSKTGAQDPSHGKRFQNESFWIPSHCHCGLLVWHLHASRSSTSRLDLKQNQTSPSYPQERTPTHTESSRPPQQGHTTSHPEIAHELGQQGPYGAARMDAQLSHR
jgi:hypothetical protein